MSPVETSFKKIYFKKGLMKMSARKNDYENSRSLILKRLKRDQQFHRQGQYEKMGESYDDFDEKFPTDFPDLMIAWTFWDAWIDERNQEFPNLYSGITKKDWPDLAQYIIDQLEKKQPVIHPILLQNFDFAQKPTWFDKLRSFFQFKE